MLPIDLEISDTNQELVGNLNTLFSFLKIKIKNIDVL